MIIRMTSYQVDSKRALTETPSQEEKVVIQPHNPVVRKEYKGMLFDRIAGACAMNTAIKNDPKQLGSR